MRHREAEKASSTDLFHAMANRVQVIVFCCEHLGKTLGEIPGGRGQLQELATMERCVQELLDLIHESSGQTLRNNNDGGTHNQL